MVHLILVYYILSFASGFASFTFALFLFLKRKDRRIVTYILFLLTLTALVSVNTYQFYRYHISAYAVGYSSFAVNALLSLVFGALMAVVPRLAYLLLDRKLPAVLNYATVILASLSPVSSAILYVFIRDDASRLQAITSWLYGFYSYLFFALLVFCLVLLAVNIRKMKDALFRNAVIAVLVLCGLFLPAFLVDANWRFFQVERKFLPLGFNFLPLFYLVWNAVSIVFGFLYFGGKPSSTGVLPFEVPEIRIGDAFVEKFHITRQEREIIVLALGGLGNGKIAQKLFISEGTVKNHMHNIYEKTGAKNRIALANLIKNG